MGKNDDGSVSKLSKRHGAVSFQDLVADGYLPEAIVNYIALLGWCPKNSESEFFTLEDLKKEFSIEGVSKSPSVFDFDKLLWFNGEYIRKMEFSDFEKAITPFIKSELPASIDREKMLRLLSSRLDKLSNIEEKIQFFLNIPEYESELFVNKKNKVTLENAPEILAAALPVLEALDEWNNDSLYAALLALCEKMGVKNGTLMWCLRIAVSGMSVTPGGATEIMEVIGKAEAIARVKAAIAKF